MLLESSPIARSRLTNSVSHNALCHVPKRFLFFIGFPFLLFFDLAVALSLYVPIPAGCLQPQQRWLVENRGLCCHTQPCLLGRNSVLKCLVSLPC